MYTEINRNCIICGSSRNVLLWDKEERKQQGEMNCKNLISDSSGKYYHMKVVICNDCGLIYTNPQMDEESLNVFYKSQYRKTYTSTPESKKILSNNSKFHAMSALETISPTIDDEKLTTFLDVGCHNGELLNLLKTCKYTRLAEGLDSNQEIEGIYHDIGEIDEKHRYDCVFCMNTLEHMFDPADFLKNIKKHVGKYIIIGVPNVFGEKHCSIDAFFSNAHLWHFSERSLFQLLTNNDYSILGIRRPDEPMCKKIHFIATPTPDPYNQERLENKEPLITTIKELFVVHDRFQKLMASPKHK